MAWYSRVRQRALAAGISFNWYGRGKHFAVMPLRGGRIFGYGTKNMPHDSPDGGRDDIAAEFSDCVDGVTDLIDATAQECIVRNRLYDLPFRRRWSTGRVVLLGDARGSDDIGGAIRSFAHGRRRRVRWIHRRSEITSRLQLIESGAACRLRDAYLWMQPGPLLARTFFRHPELQARRPSLVITDRSRTVV